MLKLVLIFTLSLSFLSAAHAQTLSTSGTVYDADGTARLFPQSSNYPSMFTDKLVPGEMGALEYCASIGARLPSSDELLALSKVLDQNYWYWSSTLSALLNEELAYMVSIYSGVAREAYRYQKNAVACVAK